MQAVGCPPSLAPSLSLALGVPFLPAALPPVRTGAAAKGTEVQQVVAVPQVAVCSSRGVGQHVRHLVQKVPGGLLARHAGPHFVAWQFDSDGGPLVVLGTRGRLPGTVLTLTGRCCSLTRPAGSSLAGRPSCPQLLAAVSSLPPGGGVWVAPAPVLGQAGAGGAGVAALGALVRALAVVDGLVGQQAAHLAEGPAAHPARVRLLPRVRPLVRHHVGPDVGGVGAEGAGVLALLGPLLSLPCARVGPVGRRRVALQELPGREALQAHLAHKQPPRR